MQGGISFSPDLWEKYGAPDRLLFSKNDYVNIDNQKVIKELFLIDDETLRTLTSLFVSLCHHRFPIKIPNLEKPSKFIDIRGYLIPGADILNGFASLKPLSPLSINLVLDGLTGLNDLMRANGIDYVLTGSLGLYIHGLVPSSYIPHDIDIIISNSQNKHPFLTNQMILDLFVQYCGGARLDYSFYDLSDLFVFYIGINKIEINALVDKNNVFLNSDYCIMNIMGQEIKVHSALSIFREKYKMRRMKDFKFNNDIQYTLNQFLLPEDPPEFDYEEFYYRHFIIL